MVVIVWWCGGGITSNSEKSSCLSLKSSLTWFDLDVLFVGDWFSLIPDRPWTDYVAEEDLEVVLSCFYLPSAGVPWFMVLSLCGTRVQTQRFMIVLCVLYQLSYIPRASVKFLFGSVLPASLACTRSWDQSPASKSKPTTPWYMTHTQLWSHLEHSLRASTRTRQFVYILSAPFRCLHYPDGKTKMHRE